MGTDLPRDAREVFKSSLRTTNFSFALGDRFSKTSHAPLVYGVLRAEIDEFLLRGAADMGVTVREKVRVASAEPHPGFALAHTSAGSLRARYMGEPTALTAWSAAC